MNSFRLILLFILAVAMVASASAQKGSMPLRSSYTIPFEKFVLDNGLEVILHEDHSDPIVAVATIVHVGSSKEKPGKTGFAHFFEHMSFNHSENTPRGANRKLIPEWGGDRNGSTWTDGTNYYEVIPKDAFEKILWIDSDRLGFMINTVTKEALEKEIQVVKNEKRQNYDNVAYGYTREIISANLYPPTHPYHWPVIGSLPDLQAASLEDVKEFYEKYYGAANATLVIAGDIDIAKTKERVKLWFGEIRKGPQVNAPSPQPVKLNSIKSFYFEDNFARLPELTMAFPTVEQYHADAYALSVLSELLSGSRNSPLYKLIVEQKKLAPAVNTNQTSAEIAGQFIISVRGNEYTNLQDVKVAIEEALYSFEKNGFTNKDLARIKAKIETGLYRGIENILGKALRMGRDNEFKGDPTFILQATKLTQNVSREDVIRVYNKYIKNSPYVMTSFVPKGKKNQAVNGASEAKVWVEKVVAGVQNEEVNPGEDAKFVKTSTKHNRSEPSFGEMPMFKMPSIWKKQLSNGLKLFIIESLEVPLVSFEINIDGGHWAEPMEKSGTASLLAGLLMQGTLHKTPAQLEEALELMGADVSIISRNEDLGIRVTCLEKFFEPTLALVEEMLLEPRWDKMEYERLYKAMQTSIKGREANATAIAGNNFMKLIYGENHILGIPSGGIPQTVSKITLDDLKSYYHTFFKPTGASFNLVGAVPKARVEKALMSLAQKWKGAKAVIPGYVTSDKNRGNKLYFIDIPGAKQSVLYVGKLVYTSADENSNNLDFANEILGDGVSGRINQVLRIGKGYTYGARSSVLKNKETGVFAAVTSVRANATYASLNIIRNMIAEYSKTFTENDAAITRNKILKSSTLDFESMAAKLGMLREISMKGKSLKYIEEDQQELLSMKLEDFKSVINNYLDGKDMIFLVVGDRATQWDEVKKLGITEMIELDIYGKEIWSR